MPQFNLVSNSETSAIRTRLIASARDGIITYKSNGADPIINNWISKIFEYLEQNLGVTFRKQFSGETDISFNFSGVTENSWKQQSWTSLNSVSSNGEVLLSQVSGKMQYGGVTDIRSLARLTCLALGLSFPNGDPWESNFTTDQTILSLKPNPNTVGDLGRTFFLTDNDIESLREIYGANQTKPKGIKYHVQAVKEDLLIGVDGTQDIFIITDKGVLNTPGKINPEGMSNDYNCVSIANFNQEDKDMIYISKELYNPESWGDYRPQWISAETAKISLKYTYAASSEEAHRAWASDSTITYDDAGKLMLNINGTEPSCGPPPFPGNGQLAAFVDVKGAWRESLRESDLGIIDLRKSNLNTLKSTTGKLSASTINATKSSLKFFRLTPSTLGISEGGFKNIYEIGSFQHLNTQDGSISVKEEIKDVFDQVTGKETKDAQMYRLYNAAFARFPDASGLRYWINEYTRGITDYRNIAQSFLNSEEFKTRYGANNSNTDFINNMYRNILGRLPDEEGRNYWVSNLDSGRDIRVNVLGGFAESTENKNLFSQVTGFT